MFSELAGLLASLDISKGSAGNSAKSKARNILMRANKQKIGSISAYSSNSIFYLKFPVALNVFAKLITVPSAFLAKTV